MGSARRGSVGVIRERRRVRKEELRGGELRGGDQEREGAVEGEEQNASEPLGINSGGTRPPATDSKNRTENP